jgi:hypothetical protein
VILKMGIARESDLVNQRNGNSCSSEESLPGGCKPPLIKVRGLHFKERRFSSANGTTQLVTQALFELTMRNHE